MNDKKCFQHDVVEQREHVATAQRIQKAKFMLQVISF